MFKRILREYYFLLIGVLVVIMGYFYISVVGHSYDRVIKPFYSATEISDVHISPESTGNVEVTGVDKTADSLTFHLRSVKPGKVYIEYRFDNTEGVEVFYVHNNGVITYNRFFGDCRGSTQVIILFILYLLLITVYLIAKYKELVRKSLYSYNNVLCVGLIVFSVYLIYTQIKALSYKNGVSGAFMQAINSTQGFVFITLPVVLFTTVIVTVSNIKLIRNEGRSWRNMLGCILGIMLGAGSVMPFFVGMFLQNQSYIDVHYERGIGRFIEMFLENGISAIVTYLECILIGTIVVSVKAAIHIPKFNKDYIIIHGCQIRKDGTLTKLLQSRADRALEFSRIQKKVFNKSLIFIPSGGKGSDEVISEGEAIKNYLLEQGISEDQILPETRSTTTEENFKFAYELIKEHHGSEDFNLAFSTTNYHVFRSGMLAEQLGIKAEGIGARTVSYYWVNAFVREFIATVVKKKKRHLTVIAILFLINIVSVAMMYLSEVVLF